MYMYMYRRKTRQRIIMLKRLYSSSSSSSTPSILKAAQFDIKTIISNLDKYEYSIKSRSLNDYARLSTNLTRLPTLYEYWKLQNTQLSTIQIQRKKFESLYQDKSLGSNTAHQDTDLQNIHVLKEQHSQINASIIDTYAEIHDICDSLPNLVAHDTPLTEPEVYQWINPLPRGAQTTSMANPYKQDPTRDHMEILNRKHLIDFPNGAKVSGSSFFYIFDELAMLETALIQYSIAKARSAGYRFVIPPTMARMEIINNCGFRPRDNNGEQQIYQIDHTDKGLVATSEITLAGLVSNRVFALNELSTKPLKMCGVSKCFRKEAGARGKDTKGLYRVHEFSKVELFVVCEPAQSEHLLNSLRDFQIDIIQELGLTAKVLRMPSNDLGAPAYQKYDIECWMPGRGSFGETSSTSNCTDFQTTRLNVRYESAQDSDKKKKKLKLKLKLKHAHTLNGTAMALPRIMLAIVENFYNPSTGHVEIPKVLQPFMNNLTHF